MTSLPEIWNDITNGVAGFLNHPLVDSLGVWMDNAFVGAAIIIFFKYVLPKLRENEANKQTIKEMKALFEQTMITVDTTIKGMTGVNLGLESKTNALLEVFDTAFKDSNIFILENEFI